ncbi:UNVERIFIED_CONTAM: hypothetical protein HDU68_011175 [Siphonaria sp. JEL0065]|nr:hypothetical protein HDU68_011175 [Siphonaria sp. JEL0065]
MIESKSSNRNSVDQDQPLPPPKFFADIELTASPMGSQLEEYQENQRVLMEGAEQLERMQEKLRREKQRLAELLLVAVEKKKEKRKKRGSKNLSRSASLIGSSTELSMIHEVSDENRSSIDSASLLERPSSSSSMYSIEDIQIIPHVQIVDVDAEAGGIRGKDSSATLYFEIGELEEEDDAIVPSSVSETEENILTIYEPKHREMGRPCSILKMGITPSSSSSSLASSTLTAATTHAVRKSKSVTFDEASLGKGKKVKLRRRYRIDIK